MPRTDWNFRSRSQACAQCGAPFAEGAPVRSALVAFDTPIVRRLFAEKLAEEEASAAAGLTVKPHPEYVRVDFCGPCWETLADPGWISAWRSVYAPPPAAPEDPLKKATPETLLRSLLEGEDPGNHVAAIYLLAVMLERKRILVERAVRNAPDGTAVHIYEHRRSGDILLVADPHLTADEIPGVQREIELLLGLRTAPAEDAAAPAPAEDAAAPAPAEG